MLATAQFAGIDFRRTSTAALVRMSVEPALVVGMLVASCLATGTPFQEQEVLLAIVAFSLTFPGDVSVRRLRHGLFWSVASNWVLVVALLLFFGWATRFIWHFDARMLWVWALATPAALYAAHRTIPLVLPQLLAIDGSRRAAIIGVNEISRRLADQLRDEPTLGFRFAGFFEDRGPQRTGAVNGPVLARIDDVARSLGVHGIDTVFVALPMAAQPRVLRLLDQLRDTTVSIYFVPDFFISDLIQARVDDLNGIPVVAVCETPFVGLNGLLKWTSDKLIAASLLAVAAVPMLVIALAVRLSSPGPVIFKQRRYGLDGREIVVWKFRTMTVLEDGAQVRQATQGDRRVTRVGAFLRRTSLDELPQLFNVLQGRMSLVGPRPHAVAHNEQYRRLIKGYMIRHKVRPGVTGWAQVNGLRGQTDTVEKMRARIEYDLDYLRRWSLGLDLLILLKTVFIVLRRTNAY